MLWFLILFMSLGPAAFLIIYLTLIRPLRLKIRARLILSAIIFFSSLKFSIFAFFGGSAFLPELPAVVIHIFSALHDSVLLLAGVGVVYQIICGAILLVRRVKIKKQEEIKDIARRRFIIGALAASSFAGGTYTVREGVRAPDVKEVSLKFKNLPKTFDGFKIAQLSDIHVSSAARKDRTEEIVKRTLATKPDMIVITGDIVDGNIRTRYEDVEPLSKLRAPYGVFACKGNHERYFRYTDVWRKPFKDFGMRMLENEVVVIKNKQSGEKIWLGGVDDPVFGKTKISPFKFAGENDFKILLFHRPTNLALHAKWKIDLQLSGHTHGGAMMGVDYFVARVNENHVRGLYKESHDGREIALYVNSGTGQWAGFPSRAGVPPEITLITLRA